MQYKDIDKKSILTDKDYKLIEGYKDYLLDFADRALLKFIKGRIEHHNEDVTKLDYQKEIENEIFDVTSYNYLNHEQGKTG